MHRTLTHQIATIRHTDERAQSDRERQVRQAGSLHHSHESIEAARAAVAAWFNPLRPTGLSPA